MKVAIGSDNPGFALKEPIMEHLKALGHEVEDFGIYVVEKPNKFTNTADAVANAIRKGDADRGVLICGTGMGMAIVANKTKGVYAAAVESVYAAGMCRLINDAKILCLGAFIIGEVMAKEMTEIFIATEYQQDMEDWRIELLNTQNGILKEIEDRNFK